MTKLWSVLPMIIKLPPNPSHVANEMATDSVEDSVQKGLHFIHSKGWMHSLSKQDRVVSINERTSLNALIAYVALQTGENEFRVERRVSDRFNVPNVSRLPTEKFDDAIRYLVDGLEKID